MPGFNSQGALGVGNTFAKLIGIAGADPLLQNPGALRGDPPTLDDRPGPALIARLGALEQRIGVRVHPERCLFISVPVQLICVLAVLPPVVIEPPGLRVLRAGPYLRLAQLDAEALLYQAGDRRREVL